MINLNADGSGVFTHNDAYDGLRLSRDTTDTQGICLVSNSGGNSIHNRYANGNKKNLNFYGYNLNPPDGTDALQFYGKFENTSGEFHVSNTTSSKNVALSPWVTVSSFLLLTALTKTNLH